MSGFTSSFSAHRVELRRVLDVELDEPADVDVRDALEAERRQRALDRDALRIEDARLRADEDARPHGGGPRQPGRRTTRR